MSSASRKARRSLRAAALGEPAISRVDESEPGFRFQPEPIAHATTRKRRGPVYYIRGPGLKLAFRAHDDDEAGQKLARQLEARGWPSGRIRVDRRDPEAHVSLNRLTRTEEP